MLLGSGMLVQKLQIITQSLGSLDTSMYSFQQDQEMVVRPPDWL